jgi:thymidylate synthase (FAD)
MQWVEPKVIHLGGTSLDGDGLKEYLEALGAPHWETDAPTGAEALIEAGGRVCYRSFAVGLNANVTRIREGNGPYLANVIKQGHGALLEHASDTYIFFDVSRVVTHQTVRHRAGTAYSQESGHYVRVEGIKMRFPHVFIGHPKEAEIQEIFEDAIARDEAAQTRLAAILDIDNQDFETKKKYTTAMRRLVPDGIATALVMSGNHRTWRWLIELRTERHNDEEIRQVFADVYRQQSERYPNLYADAKVELVDHELEITFGSAKV